MIFCLLLPIESEAQKFNLYFQPSFGVALNPLKIEQDFGGEFRQHHEKTKSNYIEHGEIEYSSEIGLTYCEKYAFGFHISRRPISNYVPGLVRESQWDVRDIGVFVRLKQEIINNLSLQLSLGGSMTFVIDYPNRGPYFTKIYPSSMTSFSRLDIQWPYFIGTYTYHLKLAASYSINSKLEAICYAKNVFSKSEFNSNTITSIPSLTSTDKIVIKSLLTTLSFGIGLSYNLWQFGYKNLVP